MELSGRAGLVADAGCAPFVTGRPGLRGGGWASNDSPVGLEAVQALVEGAHQAGAVLDAAHGALQRHGQPHFRLAQDDVGERPAPAVRRQLLGAAPYARGDRAGVPVSCRPICS